MNEELELYWMVRPVVPMGLQCILIRSLRKTRSRLHHLGTKVLPGRFIGYALNSGGGGTGDFIIADWHNMENNVASEVHVKRWLKSNRSWIPEIAGTIHISLRKWFSKARKSRTTSNLTPPECPELRRGVKYPPLWARRGVTLLQSARGDPWQEDGKHIDVVRQTKTHLDNFGTVLMI